MSESEQQLVGLIYAVSLFVENGPAKEAVNKLLDEVLPPILNGKYLAESEAYEHYRTFYVRIAEAEEMEKRRRVMA